jgi:alpha-L-rhamnosidase
VSWTLDETAFTLDIIVPPSTEAEVQLPDGSAAVTVAAGVHSFACVFEPPTPAAVAESFSA